MNSLLTILPEGRKFGAAVVIAFQSISQLRETYSQLGASTIVGQTATQVVMQAGDPETARWGQELFGSAEVEARRASETLETGEFVDRGSLSTQRETKPLVLDSELLGLGMGEAFMRLGGFPVARVRANTEYESRPEIAPSFVPQEESEHSDSTELSSTVPRRIEDEDDWLTRGGEV